MDRWWVWMLLGAAACGPSLGDGGDGMPSGDDTTGAANTSGLSASDGAVGTADDDDDDDATSDGSDGADSTGPGDIPTMLCNPAELHGPFLEAHDGSDWAAFEGCDEDSIYLERPGIEPLDTPEGLNSLDGAEIGLLGIPGVIAVGHGWCCDGSTFCISASINRWSYSQPEVFDAVHETFGELGDACFGIRLDLVGEEGPRCEADDPECLPRPVCDGVNAEACCQAPPLDPDAMRIPVGDDNSTGTCTHDGECVIFNATCADYMTPQTPGFSQCNDEISQAYCGCVDNSCHWYEQG